MAVTKLYFSLTIQVDGARDQGASMENVVARYIMSPVVPRARTQSCVIPNCRGGEAGNCAKKQRKLQIVVIMSRVFIASVDAR